MGFAAARYAHAAHVRKNEDNQARESNQASYGKFGCGPLHQFCVPFARPDVPFQPSFGKGFAVG
jgi:hypothetical protein